MFGWLYLIINRIFITANKTKNVIEDNDKRDKARREKEETYYCGSSLRLTKNGRNVYNSIDSNGHRVVKDLYSGEVYIDYTQRKKDEYNEEAKCNGKTVRTVMPNEFTYNQKKNTFWHKCMIEPWKIDIKTGCPINVVIINGLLFYMDLNSGYVLRLADNEDPKDESIQDIIIHFNNRQDKLKKSDKYQKDWWWGRKEFFIYLEKAVVDNDGNVKLK